MSHLLPSGPDLMVNKVTTSPLVFSDLLTYPCIPCNPMFSGYLILCLCARVLFSAGGGGGGRVSRPFTLLSK